MLGFDDYKKFSSATLGRSRKEQSDMIMEATWDGDISSQTAYLYDQFHDEEFDEDSDLHPEKTHKIPVEIKFFEMEYNSLSKDETPFHIMFKPSQKECVSYYNEVFRDKYWSTYPVGLYCDIMDSTGKYNRWLIVGNYRHYANQFPTYLVLPTDYKLQWIYRGKKYESWAVSRSQNSYNSGTWRDLKIESVENQKLIWLPMNDYSSNIYYNQRVVISQPIEQPICWRCTKVENTNENGINKITFAQSMWDGNSDYIERDENGNVVGMWCDYFTGNATPQETKPTPLLRGEISYSGAKPEVKLNGSYKKLTVNFYDNDKQVDLVHGEWKFFIDDELAPVTVLTHADSSDVEENQIKVKLQGSDDFLGKTMKVRYDSVLGETPDLELDIVGL